MDTLFTSTDRAMTLPLVSRALTPLRLWALAAFLVTSLGAGVVVS